MSAKLPMRARPTLLTSPSRPPSASAAPSTARRQPSAVDRSASMPVAPSRAACSPVLRAQIATRAPSADSSSAVARPMPALPPVTSTRRSPRPRSIAAASYDGGMTQVLVARHGETDWNREGRWQGHGGPGLNVTGRRQAEALAERLGRLQIDALYTSDLARAVETAEILAARVGRTPVLDQGLREVDNGDWRGLTRAQVRERNPAGYRRWLNGDPGWSGGES